MPRRAIVAMLLALVLVRPSAGGEPAAAGLEFFETKVRPILAERCYTCHSARAKKVRGKLLLDSKPGWARGGDSGPAVVPGDPDASPLIQAVRYGDPDLQMPPQGRLPAAEVETLVEWVKRGAADPRDRETTATPTPERTIDLAEGRRFWAFRPLQRAEPPAVRDASWCRTPIDGFLLAGLEAAGLGPNPAAGRRQLIRRVSFDLTGLPPGPDEVEAFVDDRSPDAYERLIDRLLASPHYGERWGRHWLDLARFAESHGFEHDSDRPSAYHYRDFVIEALNGDLPFDTFVRWQLAGDELEPDNPLALKATGFLAAGVHSTQITANQVEKERYDELDDMAGTVGTAMLGLTIGCARCHDHKYDPIPQRDYYRLLATFTTTVRSEVDLAIDPERRAPHGKVVAHAAPAPRPRTVKALISTEGLPAVRLHTQGGDFLEKTHFLKRGDPGQKQGEATPGFLQVLMAGPEQEGRWRLRPPAGWRTSYRRASLANWLTDAEHGAGTLLARVIVNRIWQHHFGRGIVATPSDFGAQGERPAHPELLDWLAGELIRGGWRLKPLHKLILASAAYRQSAETSAAKARLDPDNARVGRQSRRRLEAEALRDAMLAVGGALDPRMFGPGTLDEAQKRRSVYFTVKRSRLIPMMLLFDAPDALNGVATRPSTTIAPQSLLLMNNPNVRGFAAGFAARIAGQGTPADCVRLGYAIALGRPPDARELEGSRDFLRSQRRSYEGQGVADGRILALTDFCQVLMSLNEFVYVE